MAGAHRKTKLSTYEVTIRREVEFVATLEIEARSSEEAVGMANDIVDESKYTQWREGDCLSHTTKAKMVRR